MKKRFLLTSVMMLLLTVFALSTATYAWFSMSTTNQVKDFTITAASAEGGLEISIDGDYFYNDAVSIGNPQLKALDVTSTDGETFYKGYSKDSSGKETLKELADEGDDYFTYDLYFRTTSAGTIKLDLSNSYIVPESLKDNITDNNGNTTFTISEGKYGTAGDASTIENKAELGDFTKDWIACATRLSYKVTGYQHSDVNQWNDTTSGIDLTAEKAKICEPFKYQVSFSQNKTTNVYSINTTSTRDDAEIGKKVVADGTAYKLNGALDSDDQAFSTYQLLSQANNDDPDVITIGGTGYKFNNGEYAIVKVTVYVWIEGQDPQCITPLALGQFRTGLKFYLETKKQAEITTLTYDLTNLGYVDDGTNYTDITWNGLTSDNLVTEGIYTLTSAATAEAAAVYASKGSSGQAYTLSPAVAMNSWANDTYFLKVYYKEDSTHVLADNLKQYIAYTNTSATTKLTGEGTYSTFNILYIPFNK